jgi:hypothetical protein
MINYLIFVFYLYAILFSVIGYGNIFARFVINNQKLKIDLCELCFYGFFLLITISVTTAFFVNHGYFHNIFIHLIGIASFLIFKNWKKDFKNIKFLSILFLVYFSGILIFKTSDDFGYYHLSYTRFLSDNGFFFGLGNLGHGFRTPSLLFYFNSLNFLPGIQFFSFHFSIFYLLVFSSFFIIKKIIYYLEKKFLFLFFFLIFIFLFHNNIFYRLGEYGVDRTAQGLILLVVATIIEILYDLKNKSFNKNNLIYKKIIFAIIICCIAASFKAIFLIYLLLILRFFNIIFSKNFIISNFKVIFICSYLTLSIFLINFLSTGCILYPAKNTCNSEMSWSIPKSEVSSMMVHYEWWAKAGGGPGYKNSIDREKYIKNFVWLDNWVKRHFFNKISDFLLSISFLALVIFFSVRHTFGNKIHINKIKMIRTDFYFFSASYLLFFFEWFLNHPSMRYGGFFIVGLPVMLAVSKWLSNCNYKIQKLKKATFFLCILSLIFFNLQNVRRLVSEIGQYQVDIKASPYFILPKVVYKSQNISNVTFQVPINNMCWSTPTPCASTFNYLINNFYWIKVIERKK